MTGKRRYTIEERQTVEIVATYTVEADSENDAFDQILFGEAKLVSTDTHTGEVEFILIEEAES